MSIWYFGELTKVCAYWFKFELFQVVPITRGMPRPNCFISMDIYLWRFHTFEFWFYYLLILWFGYGLSNKNKWLLSYFWEWEWNDYFYLKIKILAGNFWCYTCSNNARAILELAYLRVPGQLLLIRFWWDKT